MKQQKDTLLFEEFRSIFDQVMGLWPITIDTSNKHLFPNGGARIPEITKIHDEIENILFENNASKYVDVQYSLYIIFHQAGRVQDLVYTREISSEKAFHEYLKHKQVPDWYDEED